MIILLGVASLSAIGLSPVPRWANVFLQRSPSCSWKSIADGLQVRADRHRWVAEVGKSSRMLRSDSAGYELWDTPDGRWWIPTGERSALFQVLAEQRENVYRGEGVEVRPGDVVLDCGAHVGVFTRRALRAGARKVVAVEPAPIALECLRRNVAEEQCADCVVVVPKGVWDKDDVLVISGSGTLGGQLVSGGAPTPPGEAGIPVTTIDKLCSDLGLDRVDFIKMDIEEAEGRALEGAAQTLRKYAPRLAVAGYHHREDCETLPALVSRLRPGYKSSWRYCYSALGLRPEVIFFRP